ncbi:hypothetical protein JKP88DRAFT_346533 [Tribonema minus]|uniref:Smr domain-containing protein n=1 Tax=Tribonema minus TaxID=303371 RepID=A0A836CII3_9STRA|nr:hypothetical protein JKP88DRAFT_346533 [Tribonema minus]
MPTEEQKEEYVAWLNAQLGDMGLDALYSTYLVSLLEQGSDAGCYLKSLAQGLEGVPAQDVQNLVTELGDRWYSYDDDDCLPLSQAPPFIDDDDDDDDGGGDDGSARGRGSSAAAAAASSGGPLTPLTPSTTPLTSSAATAATAAVRSFASTPVTASPGGAAALTWRDDPAAAKLADIFGTQLSFDVVGLSAAAKEFTPGSAGSEGVSAGGGGGTPLFTEYLQGTIHDYERAHQLPANARPAPRSLRAPSLPPPQPRYLHADSDATAGSVGATLGSRLASDGERFGAAEGDDGAAYSQAAPEGAPHHHPRDRRDAFHLGAGGMGQEMNGYYYGDQGGGYGGVLVGANYGEGYVDQELEAEMAGMLAANFPDCGEECLRLALYKASAARRACERGAAEYDLESAAAMVQGALVKAAEKSHKVALSITAAQYHGQHMRALARRACTAAPALGASAQPPQHLFETLKPVTSIEWDQPCRHYLSGECLRRDCMFAHDFATTICRYWLQTAALYATAFERMCRLSLAHVSSRCGALLLSAVVARCRRAPPALATRVFAAAWGRARGTCRNGFTCLFVHDLEPADAVAAGAAASSVSPTPEEDEPLPLSGDAPVYQRGSSAATSRKNSIEFQGVFSEDFPALGSGGSQSSPAKTPSRTRSAPSPSTGASAAAAAAAAASPAGGVLQLAVEGLSYGPQVPSPVSSGKSFAAVVGSGASPQLQPSSSRRGSADSKRGAGRVRGGANSNGWVQTGDAVAAQYKTARSEAAELARSRNGYFMSATRAYRGGDAKSASALAAKGRELNGLMKERHRAAARCIYDARNPQQQVLERRWRTAAAAAAARGGAVAAPRCHAGAGCALPHRAGVLDLHGLHVAEATALLEEELPVLCQAGLRAVSVVTGTGHHSRGSNYKARLLPAVERFCQDWGLYFERVTDKASQEESQCHVRSDHPPPAFGEPPTWFLFVLAAFLAAILVLDIACLSAIDSGYFEATLDCAAAADAAAPAQQAALLLGWRHMLLRAGGAETPFRLTSFSVAAGALGGLTGIGHIIGMALSFCMLLLAAFLLLRQRLNKRDGRLSASSQQRAPRGCWARLSKAVGGAPAQHHPAGDVGGTRPLSSLWRASLGLAAWLLLVGLVGFMEVATHAVVGPVEDYLDERLGLVCDAGGAVQMGSAYAMTVAVCVLHLCVAALALWQLRNGGSGGGSSAHPQGLPPSPPPEHPATHAASPHPPLHQLSPPPPA